MQFGVDTLTNVAADSHNCISFHNSIIIVLNYVWWLYDTLCIGPNCWIESELWLWRDWGDPQLTYSALYNLLGLHGQCWGALGHKCWMRSICWTDTVAVTKATDNINSAMNLQLWLKLGPLEMPVLISYDFLCCPVYMYIYYCCSPIISLTLCPLFVLVVYSSYILPRICQNGYAVPRTANVGGASGQLLKSYSWTFVMTSLSC